MCVKGNAVLFVYCGFWCCKWVISGWYAVFVKDEMNRAPEKNLDVKGSAAGAVGCVGAEMEAREKNFREEVLRGRDVGVAGVVAVRRVFNGRSVREEMFHASGRVVVREFRVV